MSRVLTVLFTLCFFHLLPLQAAPALASLFPQEQQQDQQQYQQQDQGPAYENFSRDQLDNLLSPVALYPDRFLPSCLLRQRSRTRSKKPPASFAATARMEWMSRIGMSA